MLTSILRSAYQKVADHKFTYKFLMNEWTNLIDTWQIKDWESYRDASRQVRWTRLNEV